MIKIETKRLLLYPISDEEMQKVIDDEKDPEMKKAYSEMLQGCLDNSEDRVWFATWNMELKEQPKAIVGDMAIYTTCKNNTFNGMPLPDIYRLKTDGSFERLTGFGYEDFKYRLGRYNRFSE